MAIVPINVDNVCRSVVREGTVSLLEAESDSNKAQLRRALLARRMALTPEQRQQRSAQLTRELLAWLTECVDSTAAIALYWAFRGEIDLQMVMDRWRAQGGRVYLPIVYQANAPLKFAPYRGLASMQRGAYGILEPMYAVEELVDQPDDLAAMLVPCVGFSAQGYRLGYGGGYYDRTFAQWRELGLKCPIRMGVADEWARIEFEPDAHDTALDLLCLADAC